MEVFVGVISLDDWRGAINESKINFIIDCSFIVMVSAKNLTTVMLKNLTTVMLKNLTTVMLKYELEKNTLLSLSHMMKEYSPTF
jgi:hypothetical protein